MAQAAAKVHRVLIVEDESLIAEDISNRLQSLGHQVIHRASTADGAVAMAPKADVILMDIRLEGARDGIDAACEIRQKYRLPVIFLTAHADQSTRDRARRASPSGYLVKPLQTASLQTTIEVAIAQHRVELDLREQLAWHRSMLTSPPDAISAHPTGDDFESYQMGRMPLTEQAHFEEHTLICPACLETLAETFRYLEAMKRAMR